MGRKTKTKSGIKPTVAIEPKAKEAIASWSNENDMELGRAISKLIYWFDEADPLVQWVVMRRPVDRIQNAYADALRKLADEVEGAKPKPDPAPKSAANNSISRHGVRGSQSVPQ